MQLVESPSSLGYSEDEMREIKRAAIAGLLGFITVKVILTYIIHKASRR
jgi:hypothetical protein